MDDDASTEELDSSKEEEDSAQTPVVMGVSEQSAKLKL